MGLSPEDKKRIYEEEKARIAAQKKVKEEAKAKETMWGVLGCFGLIVVIIIIVLVGNLFKSGGETKNPSNLSTQSIAYKMAVVERNGYVSENDLLVKQFESLLQQLDKKYVDNKQEIADETVTAKKLLKEKGINESMIKLMEGMNKIHDLNNSKHYDEYLTCYVIFRTNGYSHEKSLSLLQESINKYGINGVLKKLGVSR